MGRIDQTDLGGPNEAFQTTHWTHIHDAQTQEEGQRRAATEEVLGRYWKPVYCYLRGSGYSNEAAKDLTQSFFHEVVLGRDLIGRADRAKGRFRTYLLTALDRYVRNVHRDATTKRRIPSTRLVSLETVDSPEIPDAAREIAPDLAFHYAWASELLNRVLREVEQQCRQRGLAVHWEVFQAKVLRPLTDSTQPPSLSELCAEHGIESETRASNMMISVKRRLRAALIRHVRESVGPEADVDEEIGDLLRILSRGRAG